VCPFAGSSAPVEVSPEAEAVGLIDALVLDRMWWGWWGWTSAEVRVQMDREEEEASSN
jgi:hypothetical protein